MYRTTTNKEGIFLGQMVNTQNQNKTQSKEKVQKRLIEDLRRTKVHMENGLKAINKSLLQMESNVAPKREFRYECPYCKGHNVRININDAFCRACGERSDRIGDTLFKE